MKSFTPNGKKLGFMFLVLVCTVVIVTASRGRQPTEPCCYPPAVLQYTKSKLNKNRSQKSDCCFLLKCSDVRKKENICLIWGNTCKT